MWTLQHYSIGPNSCFLTWRKHILRKWWSKQNVGYKRRTRNDQTKEQRLWDYGLWFYWRISDFMPWVTVNMKWQSSPIQKLRKNAWEFLEIGESREGYWTRDKFVAQMKKSCYNCWSVQNLLVGVVCGYLTIAAAMLLWSGPVQAVRLVQFWPDLYLRLKWAWLQLQRPLPDNVIGCRAYYRGTGHAGVCNVCSWGLSSYFIKLHLSCELI